MKRKFKIEKIKGVTDCQRCGHKRQIQRKGRSYCAKCKFGEYGKRLKDTGQNWKNESALRKKV